LPSRAPTTFIRTSTWQRYESTIAGAARSSRSTELRFQQTKYRKGLPHEKLLFAAASLIAFGLTAPTFAADLAARPYTKAPMIAAVYDWSGFYVGLNGGGGWSGKCWDIVTNILGAPVVPPVSEGCHTASGAVAGGRLSLADRRMGVRR
jgi:hypothetical protein